MSQETDTLKQAVADNTRETEETRLAIESLKQNNNTVLARLAVIESELKQLGTEKADLLNVVAEATGLLQTNNATLDSLQQ